MSDDRTVEAREGQALVEYAIALITIALVAIAGMSVLGPRLIEFYRAAAAAFP